MEIEEAIGLIEQTEEDLYREFIEENKLGYDLSRYGVALMHEGMQLTGEVVLIEEEDE